MSALRSGHLLTSFYFIYRQQVKDENPPKEGDKEVL